MRMDSTRLAGTILDLLHQARKQADAEEQRRAEEFLGVRALLRR
ncbi:hypothetical protein [Nonomuraea sp. NPDC049400]